MKNHKEPYGAIRNQKESYGPLIWVNRTNERTDEQTNERTDERTKERTDGRTDKRTDSLLELAGFYPAAKNLPQNIHCVTVPTVLHDFFAL